MRLVVTFSLSLSRSVSLSLSLCLSVSLSLSESVHLFGRDREENLLHGDEHPLGGEGEPDLLVLDDHEPEDGEESADAEGDDVLELGPLKILGR